ncbi:hypothetical protein CgunFtcFv8_020791 [Champsocephalus gunnari]|uniref:Uncharacterized protein n=1 Tax=Champsocephalus gunnari TaxID=52237 RepID=A0AAN8E6A2_CHAGU|nr:hypothetical protein CgunFtcFv8_020791 [Champsocephalus gunnari]
MTLVAISQTHFPPHLALSDSPGGREMLGCTSCERKLAAATAGEEDASSLAFCSLQLIDAGSLLPFSLPAQLCHWELYQSPVCCWELKAAQRRLATFTPCLYPTKLQRADRETELYAQNTEVEYLQETDNMDTGGSQVLIRLSVAKPGFYGSPSPDSYKK